MGKLTPEQIRAAVQILPVTPHTAECWAEPRRVAVEAIAAYERVEALLEEWNQKAMNPGPNDTSYGLNHMCFWLELRRALYGEE